MISFPSTHKLHIVPSVFEAAAESSPIKFTSSTKTDFLIRGARCYS